MSDAPHGSYRVEKAEAEANVPLIEVIPAGPEQQPLIDDMMQLYVLDFADFVRLDRDSNGRFTYDPLPLYWTEPSRHPFLLKSNGTVAGFALVKQELEKSGEITTWDMAEFFIRQADRRSGVGTVAAHCLWIQLPGAWQVRVMESNRSACFFWESAIGRFSRNSYQCQSVEASGACWRVFHFVSQGVESVEGKQVDSQ